MLYQTNRLSIQKIDLNHLNELLYYYNHKESMQYIPNIQDTYTVELLKERLAPYCCDYSNNLGIYQIVHKDNAKVIGELGIYKVPQHPTTVELGYILHQDHWKQGLGKELILGFIEHSKQNKNITKLIARMYEKNKGSKALCISLGFILVAKDELPDHSYRLTFEKQLLL